MIGSFFTRALVLVFGYAYPAYECFKVVELNKPEIEQLRFWCQYWILVALLTVFERVGDTFVSWLPMYSEAKLAFYVYLWYPKTKGTAYVYETFFRPYVTKHETEIDRNLLELRTRAGDIVVLYWQKAASYGQTQFFDILRYVASQSQSTRPRPAQHQQPQQARRAQSTSIPSRQQTALNQPHQESTLAPPCPTNHQPEEPIEVGIPTRTALPPAPHPKPQTPSIPPGPSTSETTSGALRSGEVEALQVEVAGVAPSSENPNLPQPETPKEEAIRVTRGRLRKRVAGAAGASTR